MELIKDMVPSASLYFAIGGNSIPYRRPACKHHRRRLFYFLWKGRSRGTAKTSGHDRLGSSRRVELFKTKGENHVIGSVDR